MEHQALQEQVVVQVLQGVLVQAVHRVLLVLVEVLELLVHQEQVVHREVLVLPVQVEV